MSPMYFSAAGFAAVAIVAMIGSILLRTVQATECGSSAVFPRVIGLDDFQFSGMGPPKIGSTTINSIDYGLNKAMLIAVGNVKVQDIYRRKYGEFNAFDPDNHSSGPYIEDVLRTFGIINMYNLNDVNDKKQFVIDASDGTGNVSVEAVSILNFIDRT